jgi:hypothetical protein
MTLKIKKAALNGQLQVFLQGSGLKVQDFVLQLLTI